MPDRDGFDLIRQLRDDGHDARELPAVALTAFLQQDDAHSALLAGFQAHLPKPVDPHNLTSVIARLAGRRAERDARAFAGSGSACPVRQGAPPHLFQKISHEGRRPHPAADRVSVAYADQCRIGHPEP